MGSVFDAGQVRLAPRVCYSTSPSYPLAKERTKQARSGCWTTASLHWEPLEGEYEPEPELMRRAGTHALHSHGEQGNTRQGQREHMCKCEHWPNPEIKAL